MSEMRFRNFGGMHQFVVANEHDLSAIDALDPARWAATSVPLRDLQCDGALKPMLDTEGVGRMRVAQLVAARNWAFARLKGREGIGRRSDVLRLDDLDPSEAGSKLRHAATHVLQELGAEDRSQLSLAQVRAFRASYVRTLANGDGVVPPALVPDPEVAAFARDVLDIVGGAADASGEPGVGEAQVEAFLTGARAHLGWTRRAKDEPALLRLGGATEAAHALVEELDQKVEEFFWLCELLRAQAQPPELLRLPPEEVRAAAKSSESMERTLASGPLAQPALDGVLRLDGQLNPVFAGRLGALHEIVLRPLLGEGRLLTRGGWREVKAQLAPYAAWRREKPAHPFEKLSETRLSELVAGALPERLRQVIGIDKAAAGELDQLVHLEKLVLLQRWLVDLANNVVNFSAIYDPAQRALVEAGSLVIDGRRLEFCVRIEERAAHRKVAQESLIFLVYAQVSDRDGKSGYEVVAPVTSGERGRLRVGKRGIFIDVEKREWDAVIVDIVENPISIVEAIRAPFRRASNFVSRKIEEFAQSQLDTREKTTQQTLGQGVTTTGTALVAEEGAPVATPAPAPKKENGGGIRDLVLGGGIAFAALGSALAYTVSALANVRPLSAVAAVASVVAVIAGLSALLGWLKLRRRDMAPLLEANGWAINAHMRLSRRLGLLFTRVPPLPPGTVLDRFDVLSPLDDEKERLHQKRVRMALLLTALLVATLFAWWTHHALK